MKLGKRGRIGDDVPPILERLELDPHEFILRLSEKQDKPLIELPIALLPGFVARSLPGKRLTVFFTS